MLRPIAGFCLVCLVPNALFQAALWGGGGEAMGTPRMKGIVIGTWPADNQQRARMLDRMENAGFNAIRISWEVGPPPTEFVEELENRGFLVFLGTGGGWDTQVTTERAAEMVDECSGFENIYWGIGNEDCAPDLSVPRGYLREIDEAFKERSERPTFHAGHMVLHAPDLLILRWRGFGPVEFTDVLGYNAYPPAQAASWMDLIEMWWRDTKANPFYQAFIDAGMGIYFALENALVEPVKKSILGYGYLLHSYMQYAKLKHKPLVITEWGANRDLDFARGQWGVLRKFPELRGIFFFDWDEIDWDVDGEVDGRELYDYLANEIGFGP